MTHNEKSEILKDFLMLFFATILGAIGSEMIHAYFINRDAMLLFELIVFLLVAAAVAVLFAHVISKSLKNNMPKTKPE